MGTADEPEIIRVLRTLQQPAIDDRQVEGLVHAASQPMAILDPEGAILTANARLEALLEREASALRERPFLANVLPSERASVRARLDEALRTRQGPSDLATLLATKTGATLSATLTFLPFVAGGQPRLALLVREPTPLEGALGERVEVLERRLAESEARRSESEERLERDRKLTHLGGIVSSVAHELRSPVAYIENLAYLSEAQASRALATHPGAAPEIEPLRANAALIREGAQRIRHLLQELQPLTRNRPTRKAPVDLAVLVADAVRTFQGSASELRTTIELDLQATHPVEMDIEEMSRVLINLLKNASEAMDGGGRITIRTLNRDHPPQIRVEDEGPGVSPDARLFEPFYTTKKEGTGLGLAISKRIVEAHGGTLRHERNARGGATFVVEFAGAG